MSITRLTALAIATTVFACVSVAQPADPNSPEQVLEQMLYAQAAHMGADWWRERIELVQSDPGAYAPHIRERLLSGFPRTLDEFSLDDPRWVTTKTNQFPSGAGFAIMRVVTYLPLDHADPILQEFFDRVNPLAIEADRRRWQAEDAYRANVAGADEMMRKAGEYGRLRAARGMAVDTAQRLDSSILYDDFVAMLASDDPVAQETGANYTRGNLDKIMERHPDALAQVVEAAARLSVSEDHRVAEAGRALVASLRDALPGAQGDAAPPGEPRQDRPK